MPSGTRNPTIDITTTVSASDLLLIRQTASDFAVAYEILSSRTSELIDRKTGQYVAPYPPKEQYAVRTGLGQNWVIRNVAVPEKSIVGIVSMVPHGGVDDWPQVNFPDAHFWLSSLFVSPNWKRRNVGPAILELIKDKAREESIGSVWLDCYRDSGFLESYYSRNGFKTASTQTFTFGPRGFGAALMCCNLSAGTEDAK